MCLYDVRNTYNGVQLSFSSLLYSYSIISVLHVIFENLGQLYTLEIIQFHLLSQWIYYFLS